MNGLINLLVNPPILPESLVIPPKIREFPVKIRRISRKDPWKNPDFRGNYKNFWENWRIYEEIYNKFHV